MFSSTLDSDEPPTINYFIQSLIREGIIKHKEVAEVMKKVKREFFVEERCKFEAYMDMPLSIGDNQTISAPHMVFSNY